LPSIPSRETNSDFSAREFAAANAAQEANALLFRISETDFTG
jgi:hypothetical protein